MMMVELTSIPTEVLPVEAFAHHLRLAEGFGNIPGQSDRLEGCLRSAVAALEARLGKVFIERQFRQCTRVGATADYWPLSIAPVSAIHSVSVVKVDGTQVPVAPETYTLLQDDHRPQVVSRVGAMPVLGRHDKGETVYTAGYGPTWDDVPPALQQATLMLAEELFERGPNEATLHELPCAVCLLVEPFRDMRLRYGSIK